MKDHQHPLKLCRSWFLKARLVPEVKAVARFLATDPWFARAVCPGSDVTAVSVEFTFPLVLQALAHLRGGLRWPPAPLTEGTVDKLSGVPRLARALIACKLAKWDGHLVDVSGVDRVLVGVRLSDGKAEKREYDQRRKLRLQAEGLRDPGDGEPVVPFKHWLRSPDNNTSVVIRELDMEERRHGKAEAIHQGAGAEVPAGDGPEEERGRARGGGELLRHDAGAADPDQGREGGQGFAAGDDGGRGVEGVRVRRVEGGAAEEDEPEGHQRREEAAGEEGQGQ